jgi:predicted acylesterase/phospholipase RssA
MKRCKIVLYLAGAGPKGVAELGMLLALREANFPVDRIVATSIGAMAAVAFAAQLDDSQIRNLIGRLAAPWYCPANPMVWLSHVARLYRSGRLEREAARYIPADAGLGDFSGPDLWLTATDLVAGEPVVLNRHSGISAIRALIASSSLPVVAPPCRHGEALLIDGGVVTSRPWQLVRPSEGDFSIGVDVIGTPNKFRGDLLGVIGGCWNLCREYPWRDHNATGLDFIMNLSSSGFHPFDMRRRSLLQLLDRGRRIGQENLPELERVMSAKLGHESVDRVSACQALAS